MRRIPLVAIALAACARHDPPAPDVSPSIAMASPTPPPPTPTPTPTSISISPDPASLPQTRDRPSASGAAFNARVAALWDAVVSGDPDRAMPFFFPLGAYEQVKDIAKPAADWRARLVAAFVRDIKALHRRLGDDAARAKLDALEVPDAAARWVEPGEEYNKIGYWRVFGSKLRFEVDGQKRALDIKSLISWRGQWYVVHLSAIK